MKPSLQLVREWEEEFERVYSNEILFIKNTLNDIQISSKDSYNGVKIEWLKEKIRKLTLL